MTESSVPACGHVAHFYFIGLQWGRTPEGEEVRCLVRRPGPDVVQPCRIHIYCDRHGEQRRPITTMQSDSRGGWGEAHDVWARLKMDRSGSGVRTIAAPRFQVMTDADGTRYLRWWFECSRDPRHNVQVRQHKLNAALDTLAAEGASEVSLRGLAARL